MLNENLQKEAQAILAENKAEITEEEEETLQTASAEYIIESEKNEKYADYIIECKNMDDIKKINDSLHS